MKYLLSLVSVLATVDASWHTPLLVEAERGTRMIANQWTSVDGVWNKSYLRFTAKISVSV